MELYIERLKENGLKVTPQREAVIGLFEKDNSRKTPYAVHKLLRKKMPALGLPTVYRILEELRGIGLLIRLPSEDRLFYYSLCRLPAERHHHHFVCRKCKKVEEVEHCGFETISKFVRRKLGAVLESHSLRLEGLCADCR